MKTHNFESSNTIGKRGERIIRAYLESKPNIRRYEDVSDSYTYRRKDVDGILHFLSGAKREIEIKTDTYTTGNIFYETESCIEYNTPGCMEKTQAEYLYYYLEAYNKLYVLQMDKYRKWFHLHKHMFKYHKFKNSKKSGDTHSGGYAIPMAYLEAKFSPKYWKVFDVPIQFKELAA